MKKLFYSLLLTTILLFQVNPVFAQYNSSCPSVYGANCPTGGLTINKTVKNPQTGEFIDNLTSSDPTFLPGQVVDFRVTVSNVTGVELDNINVTDTFPQYLDFVSGPGNFNATNRVESWSIDKIAPNDFKVYNIEGRVNGNFPTNLGMTCLTNASLATTDGLSAQDTAGFCVQTKILSNVQSLPKTGPNDTALILFGSLGMLVASGLLFAVSKKY